MSTKICKKCTISKTIDNFTYSPSTKDRLRNWCRNCFAEYDKKQYTTKPRPYFKGKSLVRYWPSSSLEEALEKFNSLLQSQNNVCAICSNSETLCQSGDIPRSLAVDHCHMTKIVRGILCDSCNKGLGAFKDDPILLNKAVAYLVKDKQ